MCRNNKDDDDNDYPEKDRTQAVLIYGFLIYRLYRLMRRIRLSKIWEMVWYKIENARMSSCA